MNSNALRTIYRCVYMQTCKALLECGLGKPEQFRFNKAVANVQLKQTNKAYKYNIMLNKCNEIYTQVLFNLPLAHHTDSIVCTC